MIQIPYNILHCVRNPKISRLSHATRSLFRKSRLHNMVKLVVTCFFSILSVWCLQIPRQFNISVGDCDIWFGNQFYAKVQSVFVMESISSFLAPVIISLFWCTNIVYFYMDTIYVCALGKSFFRGQAYKHKMCFECCKLFSDVLQQPII